MKIVKKILLVVLILLSIATGVTKLIQMPAEMDLFRTIGMSDPMIMAFGLIQILAGVALILPRSRRIGAITIALTFVFATVVLFINEMIPFGIFSILFIALAVFQLIPMQRNSPSVA